MRNRVKNHITRWMLRSYERIPKDVKPYVHDGAQRQEVSYKSEYALTVRREDHSTDSLTKIVLIGNLAAGRLRGVTYENYLEGEQVLRFVNPPEKLSIPELFRAAGNLAVAAHHLSK